MNGLYEQRPVSTILDRAAEAASIAGPLASVGSAFLYCGLAQTLRWPGGRTKLWPHFDAWPR